MSSAGHYSDCGHYSGGQDPPVSVKPERIARAERMRELLRACCRFAESGKVPKAEWLTEALRHAEWLESTEAVK